MDVVWLRRINLAQILPRCIENQAHADVVHNDCKAAILGILKTEFHGTWISDPEATLAAQNKLVQLKVASSVGFRIPATLVSQNPRQVRSFCAHHGNNVVVKVLAGTNKVPVYTTKITSRHLSHDLAIRLTPAIYQECIPGTYHLRVACFGQNVRAVSIESKVLDWRSNLSGPLKPIEIASEVKNRLFAILERLRLKMGVFDLKQDVSGELVWLEVNPQGQFLFAEGLSGLDMKSAMADFLYQEAASSRKKPSWKGTTN